MQAIKRLVKDITLGLLFPMLYRIFSRNPIKAGHALFFETKEQEMPGSFDLLFERISGDAGKSAEYVTLAQNHVSHIKYYLNCIKALKRISVAQVVFLDDASDVISCLPLRSGTKVVQLWHACGAFKKWGMSTAELKFGASREDIERHPFYGNLSLVTVSSPEVIWAYVEAMHLEGSEGIVKPLGVSRTDVFFDEEYLNCARARVEAVFPFAHGKKIILYAPTFRGHVSTATGPDKLDIRAMKEALGDEWVLVVKHHPFVKRPAPIPEECVHFAYLAAEGLNIDDLLCAADICITDYSSIVFEYSLFERPLIFFAYDLADYNDWRGFYYDYDSLTPGPVVTETDEVISCIVAIEKGFDKTAVSAFKKRFMCACDGRSTQRIMSEVF